MEIVIGLFIFLFGLIIGSFLNVVIYRLETGETVVSGRSHCRDCGHILEWYDLAPILSFFALGGKCGYCRKKISWQYPLVEISTGILFVAIFNFSAQGGFAAVGRFSSLNFYFLLSALYFFFIISSLIVIFAYDLRHYVIPDKIIYPAIIVSIIYLLFLGIFCFGNCLASPDLAQREKLEIGNWASLFKPLVAAFLASGFFLAIVIFTRGKGMGGGDIKLAFLMGLILGWPNILLALFLAFATGAIYGIILIIIKKKTLKSEVPFGPFLVLGTIIAMFWGEEIVKWYWGYLL